MAVPDSINIRNLNGMFELNKSLSGDTDAVLVQQGIGWIVRQAIKWSAVQLKIKSWTDDKGVARIDITQYSTGGFENLEERMLDWDEREKDDKIFGKVKGRSKLVKVAEIQNAYLKQDLDTSGEHGQEVINAYTESVGKSGGEWTADQIWGFELVQGKRRHVRRIAFKKGSKEINLKTIYDWIEPKAEREADEDEANPST